MKRGVSSISPDDEVLAALAVDLKDEPIAVPSEPITFTRKVAGTPAEIKAAYDRWFAHVVDPVMQSNEKRQATITITIV